VSIYKSLVRLKLLASEGESSTMAAKTTNNIDSFSTDCQNNVLMMELTSKENDVGKSQEDENLCPLFMEGLPSDFSSNPSLAAIASLLGEEDDATSKNKEYEAPSIKVGGGKVRRMPARARRKKGRPYSDKKRKDDNEAVSVGEANLFLKMWKL
jgi:hypothetical protein